MSNINFNDVETLIMNLVIEPFYKKRLNTLENIILNKIIKSKNPYLFKAKNLETAQDFVKSILDASISSSEETVFGNLLEEFAIAINKTVFNGRKSSAKGIDLEFEQNGIHYLVAIKSGPNWGNSSQIAKMQSDFTSAKKTLRTSSAENKQIEFVNGCCYGKDRNPQKQNYTKLCGQDFWYFISGQDDFYLQIIEPLDKKAKFRDNLFKEKYSVKLNILTQEFLENYCYQGKINWQQVLQFNSGNQKPLFKWVKS